VAFSNGTILAFKEPAERLINIALSLFFLRASVAQNIKFRENLLINKIVYSAAQLRRSILGLHV
jgi:hypothetical protein